MITTCKLRHTGSAHGAEQQHKDSVIEQQKHHLTGTSLHPIFSTPISRWNRGDSFILGSEEGLHIFSDDVSPGLTPSSSQQGCLTPREREREKEGEGGEGGREVHRSYKTSRTERPRRNIMKLVQIKSGRAELPIKIFIIPRTFGYRGVRN